MPVLSQHHAYEVQSIESPEEGARLLGFKYRRENSVTRVAIVSEIDDRFSTLRTNGALFKFDHDVFVKCEIYLQHNVAND